MTRFKHTTIAIALGTALVAAACGGGSGGAQGRGTDGGSSLVAPGAVVTVTTGPYQPLAVGMTWTYHVNDQGIIYDKLSSVEAQEDIGGSKAGITGFRVRETIKTSVQLTWYEATATDVRRHHDQVTDSAGHLTSDEWYDPYLLRVDESPDHLMAGAGWTVGYADTKTTDKKPTATVNHSESWHVDGIDTPVTVPGGTFATLQLTRTDTADGSTKTQWFVRGVGKIREQTGAGHLEELTAYRVSP